MLTGKQEIFAQLIAGGSSQYDAHRKAYPSSVTWSRNAIDCQASKMMSDPKIIQRVNELKEAITEKVVNHFAKSKEDILIKLESLIERAEEESQLIKNFDGFYVQRLETEKAIKEIRECLKEQGKLLGYYVDRVETKDTSMQEWWIEEMASIAKKN